MQKEKVCQNSVAEKQRGGYKWKWKKWIQKGVKTNKNVKYCPKGKDWHAITVGGFHQSC